MFATNTATCPGYDRNATFTQSAHEIPPECLPPSWVRISSYEARFRQDISAHTS
jgi:hypothetical protein